MSKMPQPTESSTQSFIIRLWQESSGHWRGIIRHVQSNTQRGVTQLDQTVGFIQDQLNVAERAQAPGQPEHTAEQRSVFQWNWIPSRQMRLAMVSIGILVIAGVVVLFTDPGTMKNLAGAAIDSKFIEGAITFLAGVLGGAGGLAIWSRFVKH